MACSSALAGLPVGAAGQPSSEAAAAQPASSAATGGPSASTASSRTAPATSAGSAGSSAPSPSVAAARQRADAATDALVSRFWNAGAAQFTSTPGGSWAAYWLTAQALDAVLDGVERTAGARWSDVAHAFVASQQGRGMSSDFFDDENWMALALLRYSDLTGDPAGLTGAEALLDDIVANATDTSCCGPQAGGLWWDRAHTQKATAINAGAVITAARVYQHTGDPARLAFATSVFQYWVQQMVDPATSQVADHIDPSGTKTWWRFTYNEGTMIGAALALQQATGDAAYLDVAKRIGAFVLARETATASVGTILADGAPCDGDCQQFKGIAQRYLADLATADPGGGWNALLQDDAAAAWALDRNADDTFGADWAGPPQPATVATQSAAVMALAQAARLATMYGP